MYYKVIVPLFDDINFLYLQRPFKSPSYFQALDWYCQNKGSDGVIHVY